MKWAHGLLDVRGHGGCCPPHCQKTFAFIFTRTTTFWTNHLGMPAPTLASKNCCSGTSTYLIGLPSSTDRCYATCDALRATVPVVRLAVVQLWGQRACCKDGGNAFNGNIRRHKAPSPRRFTRKRLRGHSACTTGIGRRWWRIRWGRRWCR